jgi:putative endonuclease
MTMIFEMALGGATLMPYWVYILSDKTYGTLYTGVTSDLVKRVFEHKSDFVEGFTKQYQTHRLVYFESHEDVQAAITREKQIKKWNRAWKIRMIQEMNPSWADLYDQIV